MSAEVDASVAPHSDADIGVCSPGPYDGVRSPTPKDSARSPPISVLMREKQSIEQPMVHVNAIQWCESKAPKCFILIRPWCVLHWLAPHGMVLLANIWQTSRCNEKKLTARQGRAQAAAGAEVAGAAEAQRRHVDGAHDDGAHRHGTVRHDSGAGLRRRWPPRGRRRLLRLGACIRLWAEVKGQCSDVHMRHVQGTGLHVGAPLCSLGDVREPCVQHVKRPAAPGSSILMSKMSTSDSGRKAGRSCTERRGGAAAALAAGRAAAGQRQRQRRRLCVQVHQLEQCVVTVDLERRAAESNKTKLLRRLKAHVGEWVYRCEHGSAIRRLMM